MFQYAVGDGDPLARPGDDPNLKTGGSAYAVDADTGLPVLVDSDKSKTVSGQTVKLPGVIVNILPGPLTAATTLITGIGIKGGKKVVGSVYTGAPLTFNVTAKDVYAQDKPDQDDNQILLATLYYLRNLNNGTTGIDPRNSGYPLLSSLWTSSASGGNWTCGPPACMKLINSPAGSAFYVPDPATPAVIAVTGYYELKVWVAKYSTACRPDCYSVANPTLTPIGTGETLSPYTIKAMPAASSSANSGLAKGQASSSPRRHLLASKTADLVAVAGVALDLSVSLKDGMGNVQVPTDGRALDILNITVGLLTTTGGKVNRGQFPCIWEPQFRGVPALVATPSCTAVHAGFDFSNPSGSSGPNYVALAVSTVNLFSAGAFSISLTADGQLPAVPDGVFYRMQVGHALSARCFRGGGALGVLPPLPFTAPYVWNYVAPCPRVCCLGIASCPFAIH